jgi:hypothetical protein
MIRRHFAVFNFIAESDTDVTSETVKPSMTAVATYL